MAEAKTPSGKPCNLEWCCAPNGSKDTYYAGDAETDPEEGPQPLYLCCRCWLKFVDDGEPWPGNVERDDPQAFYYEVAR